MSALAHALKAAPRLRLPLACTSVTRACGACACDAGATAAPVVCARTRGTLPPSHLPTKAADQPAASASVLAACNLPLKMPMRLLVVLLAVIALYSHLVDAAAAATAVGVCDSVIAQAAPDARPLRDSLHAAASNNDIESACLLLKAGADVEANEAE